MPSLLELQEAMRRSIVEFDDLEAAACIVDGGIDPQGRLSVYRNTSASTLIRALRLSYPAVDRLVGAEFFDAAASEFIRYNQPRNGYLDEFGNDFAGFLGSFPPAASAPYLSDVARLDWAVSRAVHAPDVPVLTPEALNEVAPDSHERVVLRPHPSVGLVHSKFPADGIWRAVLDGNDAALKAIDLSEGPAWLIVHRGASGVEVDRLLEPVWKFVGDIFTGSPLGTAVARAPDIDVAWTLADLLVRGRCTGFSLAAAESDACADR